MLLKLDFYPGIMLYCAMCMQRHLSFGSLRKTISHHFLNMSDHRDTERVNYSLHDVLMSGVAMMFYQDRSLLQFQRRLENTIHQNNLRTLFNVDVIPKDTQMRDVIDEVEPGELEPLFDDFFRLLQRGKYLESYRLLDDYYLITIDASGYFSSHKICCQGCLTRKGEKGEVRYEHQILQAALMKPGRRQVIPLAPEEIRNTDGHKKQDCETNAGKRLLKKIRRSHPKLKIIINGDDLYSKQPFVEELKKERMSFILVAKPSDHKILMEWIEEQRQLNEVWHLEIRDQQNRLHVYEWINNVPLNGNDDTPWVNYFEYWLKRDGETTYHNSWVTDIGVDEKNIRELVKAGRCKWKIENETFNTLKNQGYHIGHNFGHGKKHLSINFFLLNLLAFLMHQIFELSDRLYQKCRKAFSSKEELWNSLRGIIRVVIFPDWETLLKRLLQPSDFL
jgi:hypothetical protein